MAIAVIVGIIFATFLTLVLVPVMYSLVDDVSAFFRRHFVTPQEVATSESVDGQEGVGEEVPGLERVPDVEPVAV
jgi:predicted RND superfamily exporter protein